MLSSFFKTPKLREPGDVIPLFDPSKEGRPGTVAAVLRCCGGPLVLDTADAASLVAAVVALPFVGAFEAVHGVNQLQNGLGVTDRRRRPGGGGGVCESERSFIPPVAVLRP